MANAENRVSTLNGWFKEQYADAPVESIPAQFRLQENVPFGPVLSQGADYAVPLVLQYPSGFTYAGSSAGAFALNSASAGKTVKATVTGSQLLLREAIDYESAKLASSSKTAFGQVTSRVVKSMLMASRKRLEIEFLYGQSGLATVTGAAASNKWTITTAEWAAGIWAGSEGAQLEVWDTTLATLKGTCTVTAVDLSARTVTVDSAPTTVNTDVLFFKGSQGNECAGVHKILTNTGTLFGVSATTFNLWKGSSFANGSAALTFTSISKVMNAMYEKGCENDVVGLISHKAFTNLMNGASITIAATSTSPLAAGRQNQEYKPGLTLGYDKIQYQEQNGLVTILPHTYVKEGSAYFLSKKDWMRIGATDLTFQLPDSDGKEFIRPMADNAGFELRAWSHQAPFCQAPGRSGVVTGIVNS
jgi:hypothetical protein